MFIAGSLPPEQAPLLSTPDWPAANPRDPFYITGPAIISFSGGRTSAYLLFRILWAHGGVLPADVHVVFANTGREMEPTLVFVAECGRRWRVPIVWLEYRRIAPTAAEATAWEAERRQVALGRLALLEKAQIREARRAETIRRVAGMARREERIAALRAKLHSNHPNPFGPAPGRVWSEVVSFETASRKGEPFRAMLASKQMLPNPVMRFCTEELKIRTVKRWVQGVLRWQHWQNHVGLRGDELHRVVKTGLRNASGKEPFVARCRLAKARVTKADHVMPFWQGPEWRNPAKRQAPQGFDLMLAGDWEGNCDLCYLKGLPAKRRMIADHPARAQEWADDEAYRGGRGAINPMVAFYRKDVPGYAALIEQVRQNPGLGLDEPVGSGMDPFAACDGGCGV